MKTRLLQALLALLLLAPSLVAHADEADTTPRQALVLKFVDDATASFFLADKPEVGFADGKLTVTSNGVATDYEQSAVAEFYFDYVVPTAIAGTKGNAFSFTYDDNRTVKVSGAMAAEAALYAADGTLVMRKRVADGTVVLNLDNCKPGVYVLTLENEQVFKLIKQ